MAKVPNGEENCRKFQPAKLGARTLQSDDRRTGDSITRYSEREREFTFANNNWAYKLQLTRLH